MKSDLEKVRDWAGARIRAGDVPDWSWHHHVQLIETIEAVLHDLSMAHDTSRPLRSLRLMERGRSQQADLHVTPLSLVRRKARIPH